MAHKLLSLSLSLSLSLNKALAQLRVTAARVNVRSLSFLLRYACSYLLHYKAESKSEAKSKELFASIKKFALDDFGSFNHSFKKCLISKYFQSGFFICIPSGRVVDIRSTQLKIENRTDGGLLPCR